MAAGHSHPSFRRGEPSPLLDDDPAERHHRPQHRLSHPSCRGGGRFALGGVPGPLRMGTRANSAWLLREFFSIHPQALHRRELQGRGHPRPGRVPFSPVRRRRSPQPWARLHRFRPAFRCTLMPGYSTGPFAGRDIFLTSRGSAAGQGTDSAGPSPEHPRGAAPAIRRHRGRRDRRPLHRRGRHLPSEYGGRLASGTVGCEISPRWSRPASAPPRLRRPRPVRPPRCGSGRPPTFPC